MIRFTNKLGWAFAALALAIGGTTTVGCGVDPHVGGSSSDLLLMDSLETIEGSTWTDAPAGCEGYLEGDVVFAIASVDEGLVAAVGEDGEIICVDTLDAIEAELEETGRHEEADHLVDAFAATVARTAMDPVPTGNQFRAPSHEGDPQPEPNIDYSRFSMGDPQPEPNMN